MFNSEMFTNPEKCIEECNKQIDFAENLIKYLEQYIVQCKTMKEIAKQGKALQDVNPFKMLQQFWEQELNKKEGK